MPYSFPVSSDLELWVYFWSTKLSKVDVKTSRSAKSEYPTVYNSTRSAKIECPTLFLIGTTEIELKKCRHRAAQKVNVRPYRSTRAAQKVNVQPYYTTWNSVIAFDFIKLFAERKLRLSLRFRTPGKIKLLANIALETIWLVDVNRLVEPDTKPLGIINECGGIRSSRWATL